jgi:hypothetical protein
VHLVSQLTDRVASRASFGTKENNRQNNTTVIPQRFLFFLGWVLGKKNVCEGRHFKLPTGFVWGAQPGVKTPSYSNQTLSGFSWDIVWDARLSSLFR